MLSHSNTKRAPIGLLSSLLFLSFDGSSAVIYLNNGGSVIISDTVDEDVLIENKTTVTLLAEVNVTGDDSLNPSSNNNKAAIAVRQNSSFEALGGTVRGFDSPGSGLQSGVALWVGYGVDTGSAIIRDGTFVGGTATFLEGSSALLATGSSNLIIEGGSFQGGSSPTGWAAAKALVVNNDASVSVYGGYFTAGCCFERYSFHIRGGSVDVYGGVFEQGWMMTNDAQRVTVHGWGFSAIPEPSGRLTGTLCDGSSLDLGMHGSTSAVTLSGDCPTAPPSGMPSVSLAPSTGPSSSPTGTPSVEPTATPTDEPSVRPSTTPTDVLSDKPSTAPSAHPSSSPSATSTYSPTARPTFSPTARPTLSPTARPTEEPSESPSTSPTATPTQSNALPVLSFNRMGLLGLLTSAAHMVVSQYL